MFAKVSPGLGVRDWTLAKTWLQRQSTNEVTMQAERWQQIEELYHAARERAPSERAAFLDQACAGDAALRAHLETLLAYDEQAENFIATPALQVAAGLIAAEQTRSLVGEQLGHYQILSLLGAGGLVEVYLAEDSKLGRKVALKLLPTTFTADRDRLRRFEQEARAASALSHPNVATIYEIGEADGLHFIAMEYVEGETLQAKISGHPLEMAEIIEIGLQVSDALDEAHTKGVTHRDIKPANLMITPHGWVKVLDFGLAKITRVEEQTAESQVGTVSVTAPGLVMGTPAYMSPEQALGRAVDHRTDIFSLGVVLYEMATGRMPFAGATANETLNLIVNAQPEAIARLNAQAPAALERIIGKCLEKDRENRYQSARELLIDLKNLKRELEAGAPATVAESQERRPRLLVSRRSLIISALVVGLVAIASLAPALRQSIRQRFNPDRPLPQPKFRRLTYDPGLQSEPSWSPDGRLIVYSSDQSGNFDLWVKPAGEGDPVQVTKSPAHDWQPDWSPDGNQLVFRSEREGGGLFVMPVLGGHARKISPFGYRPRWSPDGKQILFYSALLPQVSEVFKAYVVKLDEGSPREVLPDFLAEFVRLRVAWHPDGQRISLWGRRHKLDWSFWTAPVEGGTPVKSELSPQVERQIKEQGLIFLNFLWARSGRTLYFEGLSHSVTNLWKIEVDPQTLRWVAGPERLTTDPGADTDVVLSPDEQKLAYNIRTEQTRLWSFPFDAATGRIKGTGQPVIAAGMDAWQPDLSPDGKKLVFIALRAGEQELRVKSLEDNRETSLIAAGRSVLQSPRWSPDGARIAYRHYYPVNVERTRIEGSIVWVSAEGGEEHALTTRGPAEELAYDWLAGGAWVLGSSDRLTPGRAALSLFSLAAAPRAETQMRVLTSDPEYNLRQARLSPNQRWICFNAVKATDAAASTIFVMPAEGGTWQRITEDNYRAAKGRWSPDGKTIYFVSNRTGFFNVWSIRFDPTRGQPLGQAFRVTEFESPGRMVSPLAGSNDFALATDRLILPLTEVSGSLWILENLRAER